MEGGDSNAYIDFVKKYRKAHPGLTWKKAMKKASPSYHKLHGGEPIHSSVEPSAKEMKDWMLEAVSGSAWPGDVSGHRKAALKGWKRRGGAWEDDKSGHRKAALKGWKKREGGALHDIPILGPILGLFGLGEGDGGKLPKVLRKHHAMMHDLLQSGVLAGSGYESHAKKHRAAVKKMMKKIG